MLSAFSLLSRQDCDHRAVRPSFSEDPDRNTSIGAYCGDGLCELPMTTKWMGNGIFGDYNARYRAQRLLSSLSSEGTL